MAVVLHSSDVSALPNSPIKNVQGSTFLITTKSKENLQNLKFLDSPFMVSLYYKKPVAHGGKLP